MISNYKLGIILKWKITEFSPNIFEQDVYLWDEFLFV